MRVFFLSVIPKTRYKSSSAFGAKGKHRDSCETLNLNFLGRSHKCPQSQLSHVKQFVKHAQVRSMLPCPNFKFNSNT
ncbi:unnamed protein product [Sphenostylis stenocarpa]|uniref:Uncharacterized protein n=1 Tax=Sphenostylis stenocarpa TaxID=92480 RepID=A0AA86SZJ3_9FABA|nr:unnamed protein product [Sphenostylis stenocarpa]